MQSIVPASLQVAHDAIAGSSLWTKPLFSRISILKSREGLGGSSTTVPTTVEGLTLRARRYAGLPLIYHLGFKVLLGLFLHKRTPAPAMA